MTRKLGKTGPTTSCIGLGTMGMSDLYSPANRAECIGTIRAALDSGISLIDTGDFYGQGHNELLIADAIAGRKRQETQLSVKFGALRDPAGGWGGTDNSPAHVKNYLAQSLVRLNTDYIDIYRPARLAPSVPIEETVAVTLSPEELAAIEKVVPLNAAAGARYNDYLMGDLDSEK